MDQITLQRKITARNWVKATKDRNERYKKLNRKGKIMELCKDAIFNILNQWIVPKNGTYCALRNKGNSQVAYDSVLNSDFQLALPTLSNNVRCMVCAKGALFLSSISFKNERSVRSAANMAGNGLQDELRDAFTEREFNLIESVFEYGDYQGVTFVQKYNLHSSDQILLFVLVRILQYNGDVLSAFSKKFSDKPLNINQAIVKMRKDYALTKTAEKKLITTLSTKTKPIYKGVDSNQKD